MLFRSGNTCVWKPASSTIFSNYFVAKLLEAAGLPPGVINFVPGSAEMISETVLHQPDLAGVHFTGSTAVFQSIWRQVGSQISNYRSYPRLVGETGGKDFMVVHPSADPEAVCAAIVRGGFEFQGQKCSALSRVYIPDPMWRRLRPALVEAVESVAMGDVADFRNFMGAVIDRRAFDKIAGYMFLEGLGPENKSFYTTGRLTSEMVIKTVRMRIPILISRSGCTAWGVDLARRAGLTMIGRAKGKRFLVLSGSERIVYDADARAVAEEAKHLRRKGAEEDAA